MLVFIIFISVILSLAFGWAGKRDNNGLVIGIIFWQIGAVVYTFLNLGFVWAVIIALINLFLGGLFVQLFKKE